MEIGVQGFQRYATKGWHTVELCYTTDMNWMKRRYVKKTLLLAFLAVAGILAAEVFQILNKESAEDILLKLRAEQKMSQTMEVNGQTVTADVWQLPETSSADPLRKTGDRLLVVGKTVYVFHEDVRPLMGEADWPSDLPAWDFKPDYVVDAGTARFVSGVSTESPAQLMKVLSERALAQDWKPLGENVWQKRHEVLLAHAVESKRGTEAVMVIQRIPRQ